MRLSPTRAGTRARRMISPRRPGNSRPEPPPSERRCSTCRAEVVDQALGEDRRANFPVLRRLDPRSAALTLLDGSLHVHDPRVEGDVVDLERDELAPTNPGSVLESHRECPHRLPELRPSWRERRTPRRSGVMPAARTRSAHPGPSRVGVVDHPHRVLALRRQPAEPAGVGDQRAHGRADVLHERVGPACRGAPAASTAIESAGVHFVTCSAPRWGRTHRRRTYSCFSR